MDISTIPAVPGARHRRKRVGRGIGSGHGKTSTRGQKGQRARTGSRKHPGFEGGRNPLIRRLPKRGFRQKATGRPQSAQIVNVRSLERCTAGERITPERLEALGLVRSASGRIKLLGDGTMTKRLTIAVHQVSDAAKAKVEQAGGTVELLTTEPQKSHRITEGTA
ncbi:MAG: 50S ribosomal protein L15 [Candidatus Omnitrophica bacterium]|nr:50S ribosomal protein L15 [Candidatus Omnitrophota bacterium]